MNAKCFDNGCGKTIPGKDPGDPPITTRCKKPLLNGGCVCADDRIMILCGSGATSLTPSVTGTLSRTGYGSGPGFWALDAEYSFSLQSATDVDITNYNDWGDGTAETTPGPTSAGASFYVQVDPDDSSNRRLYIESIAAMIPSFVHSATGGTSTGDNLFSLSPEYGSFLTVDTTTGEVEGSISAVLENNFYPNPDPLSVHIDVTGSIDATTSIAVFDLDGFTVAPE